MSKAAKQSLFILIILLVASLGFAGYTILEKQKIEKEKSDVESRLKKSQENQTKLAADAKKFEDQVKGLEEEKSGWTERLAKAEEQAQSLLLQITEVSDDRDKYKKRVDMAQKERDELVAKLQERPEPQIIYRDRPVEESLVEEADKPESTSVSRTAVAKDFDGEGEQYWAEVLKEKALLDVEIGELKQKLAKSANEIVELREKNSAFELEFSSLKSDREAIDREIKRKGDIINNLSLELARTKNDEKFTADRTVRLDEDNKELRRQIQQLIGSRSKLEKALVRLTEEKEQIAGKLAETETVIQSKIDEIWDIKEGIDKQFKPAAQKMAVQRGNEVELPPIVVNSSGPAFVTGENTTPGFDGRVVSFNADNNFVIVDIGAQAGVQLGDNLSVYRDSKYIARLEVIQVRKDIAAADIKDQWSKIQIGDIIR